MGNEKMQQNEGKVKKLRIALKKRFGFTLNISPELKTLDWDTLNPDLLINPEYKQYLIWRLRKRGDQALISVFTILKYSAQPQ